MTGLANWKRSSIDTSGTSQVSRLVFSRTASTCAESFAGRRVTSRGTARCSSVLATASPRSAHRDPIAKQQARERIAADAAVGRHGSGT